MDKNGAMNYMDKNGAMNCMDKNGAMDYSERKALTASLEETAGPISSTLCIFYDRSRHWRIAALATEKTSLSGRFFSRAIRRQSSYSAVALTISSPQ